MRTLPPFVLLACATALSLSGCPLVIDDDTRWSAPPAPTCSYVCDDYGCWEICYDQTWCDGNDACEMGLYCEDDASSYYYGQCVTSPGGLCATDSDCALPNYICDERDTCVPGQVEPPPPSCQDLTSEAACLNAADCAPVYAGINCTTPTGDSCSSQSADCTCESFAFARCELTVTP